LTGELAEICPDDPEIQKRWKAIRKSEPDGGIEPASKPPGRAPVLPEKDQDIIRTNLSKVDLYVEQGLVRNARRILENLMLLYPDDPRIVEQNERLPKDAPAVSSGDVAFLVDRIVGMEAPEADPQIEMPPEQTMPVQKMPEQAMPEQKMPEQAIPEQTIPEQTMPEQTMPEPKTLERTTTKRIVSDTVSLDEIFGGTALATARQAPAANFLYPDLAAKIREELDAIEAAFYRQIKKKTAVIEKDLGEIVSEFKRQVDERIERTDIEARYNLGLAFLEQGLYDEAVAEFLLAAKDAGRTADCFALISQCWKRRRNFREALRWIDEALRLVTAGADADFSLTYERAELLEDLDQNSQALEHFRRVKAWNAKYRDVSKRVKILEKIA